MGFFGPVVEQSATDQRRAATWLRLQQEASARPGAALVATNIGQVWMSPIEAGLYKAMTAEGLVPTPQFCVQGYYVDFAFPDIQYAVEADGAAYHSGAAKQRDNKRDWILKNAGWKVQRFHGSTINDRAGNCAFVVKREVEAARAAVRQRQPAPSAALPAVEPRRGLLERIVRMLRGR
jgi:very-short-patch-repair endonuclease